ncbi:unnamed protein product [Amoebophrya sp. A25]|nr:unnamed protein product [Amoebophrya sp. A25]|eukprot:GSA25T00005724001.1
MKAVHECKQPVPTASAAKSTLLEVLPDGEVVSSGQTTVADGSLFSGAVDQTQSANAVVSVTRHPEDPPIQDVPRVRAEKRTADREKRRQQYLSISFSGASGYQFRRSSGKPIACCCVNFEKRFGTMPGNNSSRNHELATSELSTRIGMC